MREEITVGGHVDMRIWLMLGIERVIDGFKWYTLIELGLFYWESLNSGFVVWFLLSKKINENSKMIFKIIQINSLIEINPKPQIHDDFQ